jgi:hypothetical protein
MASRTLKLAIVLAALLVPGGVFAKQLAVGEAGHGLYPVYTPPNGPLRVGDTSGGFREPIYTTPPGYRYRYIRGYRVVRQARLVAVEGQPVILKKVVKKKRVAAKSHRKDASRGCVTDLGYGHYEAC